MELWMDEDIALSNTRKVWRPRAHNAREAKSTLGLEQLVV
jgi:hypothetical protein